MSRIEVAEIIIHEADEPNELADLFDADELAGKDGAEIDLLTIEADSATCGGGDALSWIGVIEVRQSSVGTN